jgi:hypothetical protein
MIVWGYIHDGPSNEYPVDLSLTTYRKRAKDWKEIVMPDEQMPQFDLVPRNKAAEKELAQLRRMRRKEKSK